MKKCCEQGSMLICGGPGMWDLGMNDAPAINFCPWCGVKLPETNIVKFEVVVRFDRGLGSEFKKKNVEAANMAEAKKTAEALASAELTGCKFTIVGSQVTPIKE